MGRDFFVFCDVPRCTYGIPEKGFTSKVCNRKGRIHISVDGECVSCEVVMPGTEIREEGNCNVSQ